MMGLTERQCDALRFIARFQREKGWSPTRREIGEAIGLRSTASAHRLIMGLVDRGAIRVLFERHRAIEILIPIAGAHADDQGVIAPVSIGLNRRQQDALRFIAGYIERNGVPPSFREIAVGIGTSPKATNYILRILAALEEQGWISRTAGHDRGITVLRTLPIPRAPDGEPLHFIRIGESV